MKYEIISELATMSGDDITYKEIFHKESKEYDTENEMRKDLILSAADYIRENANKLTFVRLNNGNIDVWIKSETEGEEITMIFTEED